MRTVVIDTETSDFDEPRVIELAAYHLPESHLVAKVPLECESWLFSPGEGRKISPLASAVHHLTDEQVAERPVFDAEAWKEAIAGAQVIAAHNARFDREVIEGQLGRPTELRWICTMKCARVAWPEAPSHGNQPLRYWLRLNGGEELALHAHRASYDAIVTSWLLRALAQRMSLDEMIAISSRPSLLPRIGFGKHRGTAWSEAPHDYLRWILRQDFDEDVRYTARHWLER